MSWHFKKHTLKMYKIKSKKQNIPGYRRMEVISHRFLGVKASVKENINGITVIQYSCDDNNFILAISILNYHYGMFLKIQTSRGQT